MSNTFCWFTSNPFSVTNLNLSCNVTSLLWSISYLVSNQSVVPTKRTNHVELSHQLNSLVHSCTVYKSRWQGTNWRLSMVLASVTQISTKCLYFPCLIKKIILLSLLLLHSKRIISRIDNIPFCLTVSVWIET